jgi:hypothetical protein
LGPSPTTPSASSPRSSSRIFVDSTAAAGEQDPERTRARLERFYDAMSSEIELAVVRADETLLAEADERFRSSAWTGTPIKTEALIQFRNTAAG